MIRGMTMAAPLESVVVVEAVVVVVKSVYLGTVEAINCIVQSEDDLNVAVCGNLTVKVTGFPAESVSVSTVDVKGCGVVRDPGFSGLRMPFSGNTMSAMVYVKPLSDQTPPQ